MRPIKRLAVWLTLGGLIAAAAGCRHSPEETAAVKLAAEAEAADPAPLDPRIAAASNAFGLRLYAELARESPGENVWISPVSVSAALTLAGEGASGRTAEEMAAVLGIDGMTPEEVRSGYRAWLGQMNRASDERLRLTVANSLWLSPSVPFKDDYVASARQNYGADVRAVDFRKGAEAAKAINAWVKERTNGKIPQLVERLDAATVAYLANAVALKGAWQQPFYDRDTTPEDFRSSASETVRVDMMNQHGSFAYKENGDYQAAKLPIGIEGAAALIVLLPGEGNTVERLRAQLARQPELLTDGYAPRQGHLKLPRMHIRFSASLADALRKLGMTTAFDPLRASFAGIAPEPPNLYINEVSHKSYLEVNEDGIEAAAATGIGLEAGAMEPSDPFEMTVDRPFLVAIEERASHSLLFVGTVTNPNG